MDDLSILIIGANGQLGRALQAKYPKARAVDMDVLDISNPQQVDNYDWSGIKIVINAAAYTNVDGAETEEGRVTAWQANAVAVRNLVRKCQSLDSTLVHISTDYVFDGSKSPHLEDEAFSPLSVYGASKAAGDVAVSILPKHYIVRSSWVIGDGKNFVKTMLELGQKGVNPTVVSDQIGRITFTSTLVGAIDHLLSQTAEHGTYNVTNAGPAASWADITRKIFELAALANKVTDVSTAEYYKDKPAIAPRPLKSELDLTKIQRLGFSPPDWHEDLRQYINKESSK